MYMLNEFSSQTESEIPNNVTGCRILELAKYIFKKN